MANSMWKISKCFIFNSATLNTSMEGYEANSLIMNVAGKILMLQKDRPAAERAGRKVFIIRNNDKKRKEICNQLACIQ